MAYNDARQYLRRQAAEYFQKNPSVGGLVDAFAEEISRTGDGIDDIYQADSELIYTMAGLAFLQIEHAQTPPEVAEFHNQLEGWEGSVD